jgi:DOPA 4,5-dioxygenase
MQNEAPGIKGFHAHVYYDPATRDAAVRVRDGLAERFEVELGRWHDKPIGPHPKSMYQVKFSPSEFGKLVPWLMLNHEGLDVLIHPSTDDDVGDHTHRALWLGEKLALNIQFLMDFVAKQKESAASS